MLISSMLFSEIHFTYIFSLVYFRKYVLMTSSYVISTSVSCAIEEYLRFRIFQHTV